MSERIAIVSTSYPAHSNDPSGHFVAAEAEALARSGHRVLVVAAALDPKDGFAFERSDHTEKGLPGLEVVRLSAGGAAGWPGLAARLRERPTRWVSLAAWLLRARRTLIERGPFDRTIAHFLLPAAFPLAASLDGRALEIVVHGSDARLCARLPRLVRRTIRASLLRRGASFRCSSHEIARTLEAALELPAGSAAVQAPALDLGTVPDRRRARELLAIAPAQRLAVVVARLVPGKRVAEALAATALVPDLDTIVIGDGPELASLERRFPAVRFLGRLPRPQTLTWIAAADVLVSASRDEGAPSVVREARALGVPVAARAAGDLEHWAKSDPGLVVVGSAGTEHS